MENSNRARIAPPEETSLSEGAKIRLYTAGGSFQAEVLELTRERVYLSLPPRGRGQHVRLQYGQAVSAVRSFADGRRLLVLLRYQERNRHQSGERDLYFPVSGGEMRLWPGMNRLTMHDWCRVKIFEIHEPEKVLAEEDAFLYALGPDAAGMLIAKSLPLGAFAECAMRLGNEIVKARLVLTKEEKLEGDPFCTAEFSFVDPGLAPRIERYLLAERARRLYTADR